MQELFPNIPEFTGPPSFILADTFVLEMNVTVSECGWVNIIAVPLVNSTN